MLPIPHCNQLHTLRMYYLFENENLRINFNTETDRLFIESRDFITTVKKCELQRNYSLSGYLCI